MDDEML